MRRASAAVLAAVAMVAARGALADPGDPTGASAPPPGPTLAIPPGNEAYLSRLLAPDPSGQVVAAGWRLAGVEIARDRVTARYARAAPPAEAAVELSAPSSPCEPCLATPHFRMRLASAEPAEGEGALLAALRDEIADRDVRDVFERMVPNVPAPPDPGSGPGRGHAASAQETRPFRLDAATIEPLALAGLWVFFLLGLALDAARGVAGGTWRRTLFLAALLAASAGFRLALATGGPGDLQMNQAAALIDPTGYDPGYGSGPGGLMRIAFLVLPRDYDVLVGAALFLGSLAPVLLVLLAEEAGLGRVAAAAAGIVLAAHPLAVRFSGEGDRQAYVLALSVAALLHLARHRAGRGAHELARYFVAATLCLNSRPEGVLLLPIAGLYTLATAPGARGPVFAAALAAHAAVVAAWVPHHLSGTGRFSGYAASAFNRAWREARDCVLLNPEYTAIPAIALAAAGAVKAAAGRAPIVAWALVCAALVTWPALSLPSSNYKLASARYQTLALPAAALAAGAGVAALADLLGRIRGLASRPGLAGAVAALALAAVAAGSLAPTAAVTAPRTIDREFRFLLATLPSLPPDARIFYTYPSSDQNADLGLRAPVWMSKAVGRPEQRWEEWRPDGPPPPGAGPRFYLHQGTCSVAALDLDPEGRALASRLGPERCADAIARFGGAPAAEVLVPAARFASDWYVSDPVRIGLYRME